MTKPGSRRRHQHRQTTGERSDSGVIKNDEGDSYRPQSFDVRAKSPITGSGPGFSPGGGTNLSRGRDRVFDLRMLWHES